MTKSTEARTLTELGVLLRDADLPGIEVRIPAPLARAAVRAWKRDDTDPDSDDTAPRPATQSATRPPAGIVALIGLCISETGVHDGDEVVVTLPVEFIGAALEAAAAS